MLKQPIKHWKTIYNHKHLRKYCRQNDSLCLFLLFLYDICLFVSLLLHVPFTIFVTGMQVFFCRTDTENQIECELLSMLKW